MKEKVVKAEAESMSIIVLDGVTYELTDKPSHGVVRGVKKMQKDISINLIKKNRAKFGPETPIEDALQKIFDEDPAEIVNFTDANEEFVLTGTISIATNKLWTSDMISVYSEDELKKAYEKCVEKLGGDIYSFLQA